MQVDQRASTDEVLKARERYVPRGVSTPQLVVSKAWGARVWDAEGREYLDFGGGIACQNLGHGNAAVVRAVHEQVDRFLHQCFMVGAYEPYVAVAEKLDELWPGNAATKTLLVNSGAEAIENAVKIARAATGRAGVVVFDRAFHGRTNLTMAMTAKLVYKQGFGPLATDVYRAPAPYPYRGVSTEDALAGLELLFKQDVDPADVAWRDPQVVFASWCGKKVNKDRIRSRAGWNHVSAVRDDRIYEIKSTYILQPGPASLTEGVAQIHAILAGLFNTEDTNDTDVRRI